MKLVKLLNKAPRMAPYLIGFLLQKVRIAALQSWKSTYKGNLPLGNVAARLGFDTIQEVGPLLRDLSL